jgi:hemolysin activation/secretion protein
MRVLTVSLRHYAKQSDAVISSFARSLINQTITEPRLGFNQGVGIETKLRDTRQIDDNSINQTNKGANNMKLKLSFMASALNAEVKPCFFALANASFTASLALLIKRGVKTMFTMEAVKAIGDSNKLKLSSVTIFALLSNSLLFADVPTVGNPMQGVEPKVKPKPAPSTNFDNNSSSLDNNASTLLPSLDDNRTVFIKSFNIVGNKIIPTEELLPLLTPYENKELTMKQINDASALITKRYREKGYFVARAYVAPNALSSEGVLTITIITGTYGKIKVDNSSLVSNSTIQDIFDNLSGESIKSSSIERATLLTNDLAGALVTSADIMPGTNVGESDFIIKTVSTPRFDGYLTSDNYGSIYNGLYRFTLGANVNSALGIGDKLSVTGMLTDGYGMKNGSINYGAPIMSNGLNLSAGYYNTQYVLGGIYGNLGALGTTSAAQANLSYPVIRSKLENLNIGVNPQYQLLSDKQLGDNIQKRAGLAVFSVDYSKITELISNPMSYKLSLGYTTGNLSFKDPVDAGYNSATINTQGRFNKLTATLNSNNSLTDELSFKNTLNAQFAMNKKNLDGSQDLTIGGAYAVRAFPSTQESVDSGYIYTAELSYALPMIGSKYSHNVGLFYDIGRGFNANTSVVPFNSQALQDVGVGYSLTYDNLFAKLQLAEVVGGVKVQGVQYYSTKGLFQVGWVW